MTIPVLVHLDVRVRSLLDLVDRGSHLPEDSARTKPDPTSDSHENRIWFGGCGNRCGATTRRRMSLRNWSQLSAIYLHPLNQGPKDRKLKKINL